MEYHAALLIIMAGLGTTFFTLLLLNEWRKKSVLNEIRKLPFTEQYEAVVARTPHYHRLSNDDKLKLQRSIITFTHTKEFIGVGLSVTDEMKVLIAFYACLLLIHKNIENCYDNLKTIIIYPHSVMIKEVRSYGGIYAKEQFMIQGQSANDTVVITWHEARKESYHMRHTNVIIHEFAHEIDFMDGEIDGVPPLEHSKYDGWVNILYKEFNALNTIVLKDRDWGKYKLLGAYAASNEAEFFAVVTERFFESPAALQKHFPQLYDELEDFYQIDTAELFS
ncbi:MAG: zinc-dependent peptidase [Campylobacterales bacterium]|nr:zinc-dependent peptidase [Campylobacterales bacterium]